MSGDKDFYVDLVRVIGSGVALSAVEHLKYWTANRQRAFIDGVVRLFQARLADHPENAQLAVFVVT